MRLLALTVPVRLDEHNSVTLGIKASILTESGIADGKKANLVVARRIFAELASDSQHGC